MPTKQQITTIGVLGLIALGLGYWSGMPEKDPGQRAEVVAPTVITNVVTNTLRKVVTNVVTATPQPTPAPAPVKPQLTPTPPPVKTQPTTPNIVTSNTMNPIVEKAIREELKIPTGKLNKADLREMRRLFFDSNQLTDMKGLEKLTQLTYLNLNRNKLTDVKGLEKLTQLQKLFLYNNPGLYKFRIDELQKALPNCEIYSNPTK